MTAIADDILRGDFPPAPTLTPTLQSILVINRAVAQTMLRNGTPREREAAALLLEVCARIEAGT